MKKLNFFLVMLTIVALTNTVFAATPLEQAKTFETSILKLTTTGFDVSGTGSTEMSAATAPDNWVAATGSSWTSSNCFAANITSVAHIGKSVQFGSSLGTGSATTPFLDLSAVTGKSTKVRVVITAGSNKTGSMAVKLNGTTIGTISAATSAPGGTTFGAYYYIFEYDITNSGTASSTLSFEQSGTEALGYLYVKEIAVYREPITLLKMDCSLFSATSTTILSSATYPNNWTASIGANPYATSYMYAQLNIASSYGQGVRMGASANASVGSFTTNAMDLASSSAYKTKMYAEILMTTLANVETKLDMKVDANAVQWSFNPLTDNGSNAGVTIGTWVPYETEISGGTSSSKINLTQTRNTTETTSIYMRNFRIYRQYPEITTVSSTFSDKDIKVYPNPFTNQLLTQANHIQLFNLSGIKILDETVINGIVNVSNISKGAYMVKCYDVNGNYSIHKLVKN